MDREAVGFILFVVVMIFLWGKWTWQTFTFCWLLTGITMLSQGGIGIIFGLIFLSVGICFLLVLLGKEPYFLHKLLFKTGPHIYSNNKNETNQVFNKDIATIKNNNVETGTPQFLNRDIPEKLIPDQQKNLQYSSDLSQNDKVGSFEIINKIESSKEATDNKNRKRILVIDHDSLLLKTIVKLLREICGYDSYGICIGESDKELLDDIYSVDMVILGIVMPRIGGIEYTKIIRDQGLDIPIILMTSLNTLENAIESMKAGADDLIIKPISNENLISSIQFVLEYKNITKKHTDSKQADLDLHSEEKSHFQNQNIARKYYYDTRELMAELNFEEGKLNGVSRVYRRWGTILYEGYFQSGVANGWSKWFDVNGQIHIEDYHRNGDRLNRNIY